MTTTRHIRAARRAQQGRLSALSIAAILALALQAGWFGGAAWTLIQTGPGTPPWAIASQDAAK